MPIARFALALVTLTLAAGCAAAPEPTAPEENVGAVESAYGVTSYAVVLGRYGGNGGTKTTTIACNAQDVVVGIHGRAGNVVDRVGLVCARLRADGTLGTHYTVGSVGGNGGTPFYEVCDPGMAAYGYDVRSATYVDQLALLCSPPRFFGGFFGGEAVGGNGGEYARSQCPDDYLLRSITVRSGNVVDAIQGRCWYVGEN